MKTITKRIALASPWLLSQEFDDGRAYTNGECCTYGGRLYLCIADLETVGTKPDVDDAHWSQRTMDEIVSLRVSGKQDSIDDIDSIREHSENGNLAFTTVQESSGEWDDASEKSISAYTTISGLSGGWNDATTVVESNSANWDNASTVINLTGDWDEASQAVKQHSSQWSDAYSAVNDISAVSAYWNSGSESGELAYNILRESSADWDNTYAAVDAASADWNNAVGTAAHADETASNVYTTVESNSADWSTACEELTWLELKTKKRDGELVPGRQYRITDYVATTVTEKTASANRPFDIVVTAISTNDISEVACAVAHSEDGYFSNSDLSAWKVWYCLDNDTNRFDWAVNNDSIGRGVVYRLIDEFGNDCPYDFKGLTFLSGSDMLATYRFTFDAGIPTSAQDVSVKSSPSSTTVHGNVIAPLVDGNRRSLNDIVAIGAGSSFNTFGNNCSSVRFGSSCSEITLGGGCESITIDGGCRHVEIGNNCSFIEIGEDSEFISVGSGCKHIAMLPRYRCITVETGVENVSLECGTERSSGDFYQNVLVAMGTTGTITDSNVNQAFKTTYQPSESLVINIGEGGGDEPEFTPNPDGSVSVEGEINPDGTFSVEGEPNTDGTFSVEVEGGDTPEYTPNPDGSVSVEGEINPDGTFSVEGDVNLDGTVTVDMN